MGCMGTKPQGTRLSSTKGIVILHQQPTLGQTSQVVEIEIQHSEIDTDEEPSEVVTENDYKLTLQLASEKTKICSQGLSSKILRILKRANNAQKRTLLIRKPTFTTDDPLLNKSITNALFKQFAIAILQYSSQVNFPSLKYIYFEQDLQKTSELHERIEDEIKSMRVLLA